jgi:putative AlgH/UPF0301 family transcriptional regulator
MPNTKLLIVLFVANANMKNGNINKSVIYIPPI